VYPKEYKITHYSLVEAAGLSLNLFDQFEDEGTRWYEVVHPDKQVSTYHLLDFLYGFHYHLFVDIGCLRRKVGIDDSVLLFQFRCSLL
jgi:hypothetical protein